MHVLLSNLFALAMCVRPRACVCVCFWAGQVDLTVETARISHL